jgi:uncharacterized protein RhaS with RHS repeats
MYDYGYRDYKPENARFTTVDPVRDGSNWFAYVNNDPVNWVDRWGLSASDKSSMEKTWNSYADALTVVAGAEILGLGGILTTGGVVAITSGLASGAVGVAATGVISGFGFVVIGAGIIGMGIDMLEGNGLDHTMDLIDSILGRQ